MSNNALGCSSRWVADCELRGVWCGISTTKAASVLASIWGSTGECAIAMMDMDVALWKGDFVIWLKQRGCRTSKLLGCNRYPVLRVTRATICTAPTSLTCGEVPTWKGFSLVLLYLQIRPLYFRIRSCKAVYCLHKSPTTTNKNLPVIIWSHVEQNRIVCDQNFCYTWNLYAGTKKLWRVAEADNCLVVCMVAVIPIFRSSVYCGRFLSEGLYT
jgi:hypothetical protein